MSNGIKISQLVDGGSITQQDYLPVARGSDETYKIAAKQFVVNASTQGSGIPIVMGKEDGAGQTLLFRSLSGVDGISIVNVGNTTVVSGSGQNPIKTVFTGTGSQVDFPFPLINTSSRNVNNYRVDIDGVLQEPGQTADYYLNGSNLTFTSAPPLSSKIVVVSNNLLPLAESVPANNSITNAMFTDGCINTTELSSGAVTTDKIALSAVTTDKIALGAVTTDKIALSAVTTQTIANSAVTAEKMSGGQTGSAPVYGCRAWVNFDGTGTNGTDQNIKGSGNVSSVYRTSGGYYTVKFNTFMPDINYAAVATSGNLNASTAAESTSTTNRQISSVDIYTANASSGSLLARDDISVVIFR